MMKLATHLAIGACLLSACSGGQGNRAADTPAPPAPAAVPAPASVPAPTTAGLAGTQWRLVEMQSMDDAQGTTKPDNPEKYTLSFGTDGTVAVQLDCNRGTGSWNSMPGNDGSGTIEFGPLATTRAFCPEPSLGEKLATQLGYVRSYLLRDGRLNLSLMADGGILVFEPLN